MGKKSSLQGFLVWSSRVACLRRKEKERERQGGRERGREGEREREIRQHEKPLE